MSATKTNHTCPACDKPLLVMIEDGTTFVYCGYGPCPSTKANDGLKGNQGETADELAKKLVDELERDLDWLESDQDW